MIKIIESPREGMQGIEKLIPTDQKIRYINAVLKAGFDTVETGSIVSPRVVPQMADSLEVLNRLDLSDSRSDLMFLALNRKSADILSGVGAITHISYPFSFSSTFLSLNVRSTVEEALATADYIVNLCGQKGKTSVIYISYAYGNPYGDAWSLDLLSEWVEKLTGLGAQIMPLSNVSTEISAEKISEVYGTLIPAFPDVEFGLHLHTANHDWYPKLEAAWEQGVRRFDSVIDGHGGCPMSGKELLGNLMTQNLRFFLSKHKEPDGLDDEAFGKAVGIASETFNQ
jgi:hydroxymethylglutaryl-CoA lyase